MAWKLYSIGGKPVSELDKDQIIEGIEQGKPISAFAQLDMVVINADEDNGDDSISPYNKQAKVVVPCTKCGRSIEMPLTIYSMNVTYSHHNCEGKDKQQYQRGFVVPPDGNSTPV